MTKIYLSPTTIRAVMQGGTKLIRASLAILTVALFLLTILGNVGTVHISNGMDDAKVSSPSRAMDIGNDIPEVLFDESHRQWWSIWDTGFIGYSDLALSLVEKGYKVSANTIPLPTALESLGAGDVLVLGIAYQETYSQVEIDAILDFVHRGGGLMVMGEWEEANGEPWFLSDLMNPITENFGIHFNSDDMLDPASSHPDDDSWLMIDVDFLEVKDACLFLGSSLNLTGDAVAIATTSPSATPPNAPVVARSAYGSGRVIAITDNEFIQNGDSGIGISYANNSIFVGRVIDWLSDPDTQREKNGMMPEYDLFTANEFQLNLSVSGPMTITTEISGGTITPTQVDNANGHIVFNIDIEEDGLVTFISGTGAEEVYFLTPPNNELTMAIFDAKNGCRRVDDSQSGLLSFAKELRDGGTSIFSSRVIEDHSNYNAVIIANPLAMPDTKPQISDTKYVLIGESYTRLWAMNWIDKYSHEQKPVPINEFAKQLGVEFTQYTIYDPVGTSIVQSFNPRIQNRLGFQNIAYRSGMVIGDENMIVLANATNSAAWAELYDVGERDSYELDSVDYRITNFVMYDDRAMGIGDTDLLTNAHLGDDNAIKFARSIASWIALSGHIEKKAGFFGQTHLFYVNTSADATEVTVRLEDGTVMDLEKEKKAGTWSGKYVVPENGIPGNYTANITVKEFGGAGYLLELDYKITEINPWPPSKIMLIISFILVAFLALIYAFKKYKNIKED
ncbi:MAG: hypothetical protein KAS16_02445 [Thermoplasmata archaeon]|nr:hypothetical protein [Thermoplasmata archaeon]